MQPAAGTAPVVDKTAAKSKPSSTAAAPPVKGEGDEGEQHDYKGNSKQLSHKSREISLCLKSSMVDQLQCQLEIDCYQDPCTSP